MQQPPLFPLPLSNDFTNPACSVEIGLQLVLSEENVKYNLDLHFLAYLQRFFVKKLQTNSFSCLINQETYTYRIQVSLSLQCQGDPGCSPFVGHCTRPGLCSPSPSLYRNKNDGPPLGLSSEQSWNPLSFQALDRPCCGEPRSHAKGFHLQRSQGNRWKTKAALCKARASLKLWWVELVSEDAFWESKGINGIVSNKGLHEAKPWREIRCRLEMFRGVSSNASNEYNMHPFSSFLLF